MKLQNEEEEKGGVKKPKFDIKETLRRRQEADALLESIPQEDEETVKLRGLASDITEEEIENVMRRFGKIKFVRVPLEEQTAFNANKKRRNRGFAFVTFESKEFAQRALEQGEVIVDISTIEIEKALKRPPQNRGGYDDRQTHFVPGQSLTKQRI
jgi:RNA recognition motif-containing protein